MKYLSRKKAIELCIELWSWLAETGKHKNEWPDWKKYEQYYYNNWNEFASNNCSNNCWFCEYTVQQTLKYHPEKVILCDKYCPLFKQIGHCNEKTYFHNWHKAKTIKTRKKYAKLFLEQIKSLR